MNMHRMKVVACAVSLLGALIGNATSADTLGSIMQVGQAKTAAAQQSQARIDKVSDQTSDLLSQYKTVNKEVDGLRIYNQRLEIQIANQLARLEELEGSIGQVTVIQRQITPLILRMIDGLEQFVSLDMPFKPAERSNRIAFLRANVDRSDISAAEKFRQVLEAYKIENEYGRKIQTYSGEVDLDGSGTARKVDLLQVGRIALLAQTTDKEVTAAWSDGAWQELDSGSYRSAVSKGIRIAKKQAAIDIMTLPIPAPEAAQ
ncbi:MAG: DUF3450 domain-containing protein [Pseudomonadales bacterium]